MDAPGKAKIFQVIQERAVKALAFKKINVRFIEPEVLQDVEEILETGEYGVAAAERQFSEKVIEYGLLILVTVEEIDLGHSQLVLVRVGRGKVEHTSSRMGHT
jgi:hypothetical protein